MATRTTTVRRVRAPARGKVEATRPGLSRLRTLTTRERQPARARRRRARVAVNRRTFGTVQRAVRLFAAAAGAGGAGVATTGGGAEATVTKLTAKP